MIVSTCIKIHNRVILFIMSIGIIITLIGVRITPMSILVRCGGRSPKILDSEEFSVVIFYYEFSRVFTAIFCFTMNG